MVVKVTRPFRALTRAVDLPDEETTADPVDGFKQGVEETVACFRNAPVTPESFLALENELKRLGDEACRQVLQREVKRIEPRDKSALPKKVRFRKQTYRINKRTPARIATRFGAIVVRSFLYLNEEAGEPGLHPLRLRLGIGAGSATPALLERVARMAVDHTQAEVRAWLLKEHGLTWSNTRLRAALAGFRQALLPYVPELQKQRLLQWLEAAQRSRGRYRPVLATGRDGIMTPMRHGAYEEASTATVSVYDRQRHRLGTIYLGQMPEAKQTTLSRTLTALLKATLGAWSDRLPRLAYITDKGSAPDEYYRKVLKKMKHPRDGKLLEWEWVLDFYHVAGYIGKMVEPLFGSKTKVGMRWFAKMRRWLRDRRQGVSQVLRSATQHLNQRDKMTKGQKEEYWKAYRYLRRHRRWMDYADYRRRGLPIGSGVTEAACKTVFTQRFKRSGMRWHGASGQVILDLRVIHLSGLWDETFAADLAHRELPEPLDAARQGSQPGSNASRPQVRQRFAA
jgi:hypothetical protein